MMVHAGVFLRHDSKRSGGQVCFSPRVLDAMAVESTVPIIVTLPLSMP